MFREIGCGGFHRALNEIQMDSASVLFVLLKKKLHAHASVHQFQAFVLNLNDSILLYLSCANSEHPPPPTVWGRGPDLQDLPMLGGNGV